MVVLPIVMFGSNVKLLKVYKKSLSEESTKTNLNDAVDDSDSSIINQLLNNKL